MATPTHPRLPYPPEFRARVIELARTGGLRPGQVAQDLGVDPDTIRRWLRQPRPPQEGPPSTPASARA